MIKIFRWIRDQIASPNQLPDIPLDMVRAKKECKILVIDDDPAALPIEELRNGGYNIVQKYSVDAQLLKQCEQGEFDIILLDYVGIAPPAITSDDGFGVFRRIRTINPSQYIIAISGKTYDISKTEYLRDANQFINKPADYVTTATKLDQAICATYDPKILLNELFIQLPRYRISQKDSDAIKRLLLKKPSRDKFNSAISTIQSALETTSNVHHLIILIEKISKAMGVQ